MHRSQSPDIQSRGSRQRGMNAGMSEAGKKERGMLCLIAGGSILILFVLSAVMVPYLSPYGITVQDVSVQNKGCSIEHLFGTDKFGRDLFTRVWYGTRISLTVGLLSTAVNTLAGVVYGGIAGYAGRRTGSIMMRAADIVDAVPSLLYVILIVLAMGAGIGSMVLGICISGWTRMARLTRGEILRLKNMEYIQAAQMAGDSALRILWKQMLPNMAGVIIVNMVSQVPEAIFTESFLSFVGVGIAAPQASLGTLIQDARSQMQLYPGQMFFPVLALCLLILALDLAGTGLQQTLLNDRRIGD